jgi:arylsulfatase A-like enzyme
MKLVLYSRTLIFLSLLVVFASPRHSFAALDGDGREQTLNILWLVVDDVGIELPSYGESGIATPNIDRLAREGTKFTRAFVTAPICSTSRSAMITGMYQTSIGAQNHVSGRRTRSIELPGEVEPLPVIFQRAGYYTANSNFPIGESRGKTDYNFEWNPAMYDGIDWSGRDPGQPFFAQVQLWGGKYRENENWFRGVAPSELGYSTNPQEVTLPPYYPRDTELLEDRARYLDTLRYTDLQVGQILDQLEAEGVLNQTLIVFMGDHGISHARGKQFLYDEGIHIPFILRGPGIQSRAIRHDLIEHIDMAALSLAYAGLEIPEWMQARDILADDYEKRDAVFAARDRAGETVDRIRSVRTERFKYIRNFYPQRPLLQPSNYKDSKPILHRLHQLHEAGELNALQERVLFAPERAPEELYDLIRDPYETRNVADHLHYQEVLEGLRERLLRWSHETGDPPPESPAVYGLEMENQIVRTRGRDSVGTAAVVENIELYNRWAEERPLQMDLNAPDVSN